MKKTITLKFAGKCRDCGFELPAGSRARWYGKGRVYCADGHKGEVKEIEYRGSCEDAPCCGCCGANVYGGYDDFSGSWGY